MVLPIDLGKDSYNIIIEAGGLAKVAETFGLGERYQKVLVVTDSGVPAEYADGICAAVEKAGGKAYKYVIPQGEASKNFDVLQGVLGELLANSFSRSDCVVACGGGVVGDLSGFAAACYMRGIDFYNIPTTLLSQVDSSVGGKTAIDFQGVKNIVGAFYQPKGVLIDPDVLATLDDRQFACGVAEIVKMAMTFDADLFAEIEKRGIKRATVSKVIARALRLKIAVVEQDEKEAGLRKALNFGHTLGHGIEAVTGLLHGESVALGMLTMCSGDARKRLIPVLAAAGLLDEQKKLATPEIAGDVVEVAMHDKKAKGGEISCVLVDKVGEFYFESCTRDELLARYMEVFA